MTEHLTPEPDSNFLQRLPLRLQADYVFREVVGLQHVEVLCVESERIIGVLERVSTSQLGDTARDPLLYHSIDGRDLIICRGEN